MTNHKCQTHRTLWPGGTVVEHSSLYVPQTYDLGKTLFNEA